MTSLITLYQTELRDKPLMPALLAQGGIHVPPNRLISAPDHIYSDTRPGIYVYDNHLVDYGDDRRGYDLLKVAREWLSLSLEQAVALLCELAGIPSPQPFRGEVKRVRFSLPAPAPQRDPQEYAVFASRAAESLLAPETDSAVAAAQYLVDRDIYSAALHFRCGVADGAVQSRAPWRAWRDMITMPTWYEGQLCALKGRNLSPKRNGRMMLNLKGTTTVPFGLRELRGGAGDAVIVVEGETDVLSVWTAFDGDVDVVGVPGAGHWDRLRHPALEGRPLLLCLDADEASGVAAMRAAQGWAAEEGRKLTLLQGIGDKNDLLLREGAAGLRGALEDAVVAARRRVGRVML